MGWAHGCRACFTPNSSSTTPAFPPFVDLKRFFDCKLKEDCDALPTEEAPLNYFVSGLDEWRSSPDSWPPLGLTSMGYQLTQNGSITTLEDQHAASSLDYRVDSSTTTGVVSRWNLVQHLMKRPVVYSNRAEEGAKSLTFQSAPGSPITDEAVTIVGSCKVSLGLEILGEAHDAVIFAVLEDVFENDVVYITEGQIRASHSVTETNQPGRHRVGSADQIHRSYFRGDSRPLASGTVTQVEFLLEPVAFTLRPGHALRLSLAGADKDNFFLENVQNLAMSCCKDAMNPHIKDDSVRM